MSAARATSALADPAREHPVAFALVLGGACGALGFGIEALAWESHFFRDRSLHVATVACLVAVLARGGVAWGARSLLGTRGPVVAWRALTVGALALSGYHLLRLDHMLGVGWSFFGWFRDLWECEPEGFGVPVAVALAAFVGARTSLPSRGRVHLEGALAAMVAVALLGVAWRRGSEVPAITGYIASLPSVGSLPSPTHPLAWDRELQDAPSTQYSDHVLRGVTVRRFEFPHRGQCAVVRLVADEAAPTVMPARYGLLRDCEGGTVRHDAARGLYVLVRREGEYPDVLPLEPASHAVRSDGTTRRVGEFRDGFTLPAGWRWASAALVAAGVAVWASGALTRRSLRTAETWRQGTLRDDGTIAVDGSATVLTCPYGTTLAPGPVVIVGAFDASGEGPFRGAPTPIARDALRPGLVADVIAAQEAELDAGAACATAAFVMAAAPLAAAAALRLLG
jgi:hypothetical protein